MKTEFEPHYVMMRSFLDYQKFDIVFVKAKDDMALIARDKTFEEAAELVEFLNQNSTEENC